ncbi:hypothetical protein [Occallatibacter savannae]|uniref:hypothetical protein n=1 Tax=Occallatibacter savannae TaxID=1002691 RepID=UPI000D690D40|nr:hypothetical protein [Occallatibacter savannae]
MLTAPILYVGDDICHRIPVFQRLGARVRRVRCSAGEVREAFSDQTSYSAVSLHQDVELLPPDVLAAAASSSSPLVLFENPAIPYDPARFDLIIEPFTPPVLWLQCIQDTIEESRKLRAQCEALREDSAALRTKVIQQRVRMHQLLATPIDLDDLWRLDWNTLHPVAFAPKKDAE